MSELYSRLATKRGIARYRSVELDTQVYIDPTETFTVVVVSGERYAGVGVAKRNPKDKPDLQVGYDVASARALRELADQVEAGAVEESPQYTYTPLEVRAWNK